MLHPGFASEARIQGDARGEHGTQRLGTIRAVG
jgi:hypothetical protein